MRPFEQQTILERTLRAYPWRPTDLLERSLEALPGHVRRKEYRKAADCQESIITAGHEIEKWQRLLDLYEAECPPITAHEAGGGNRD